MEANRLKRIRWCWSFIGNPFTLEDWPYVSEGGSAAYHLAGVNSVLR
jgi:hypothetical protein